jgi:hypothetical protein
VNGVYAARFKSWIGGQVSCCYHLLDRGR